MVYKVRGQDDCQVTVGSEGEHTTAKQEGLESKSASHKSLGCNCERSKPKPPYKVTDSRKRI